MKSLTWKLLKSLRRSRKLARSLCLITASRQGIPRSGEPYVMKVEQLLTSAITVEPPMTKGVLQFDVH